MTPPELLQCCSLSLGSPGACSIKLYGSVNYGFVVTAKIYDHFAVNYDKKCFRKFCRKL